MRSKLAGEQIALELARQGGHIVIVNPTAMLGPGDWRPTASGRRVLDFLGGRIPRYPAGGINWCPVDDVALGMIQAIERGQPGRRYIWAIKTANLDLDGFLALFSQASGLPIPAPPQPGFRTRAKALLRRPKTPTIPAETPPSRHGPDRLTCDPTRAITELGLPQSDLLTAARQQVSWYRERGFVWHRSLVQETPTHGYSTDRTH